ncbi:MAG: YaaR family protein [Treponema sp.]|jgi:uncharacterized protein YaaR (DUF327 family)|nr:YaaR family protein [Treponema sp.]
MNLIDPTSLYFSAAAEAASMARKKEKEARKASQKQNFSAMIKESFEASDENLKTQIVSGIDALPYEQAINKLKELVNSTGEDLRKNQMPEEMKKYKEAVKQFVDYVVKNNYDVEQSRRRISLTRDRIIYKVKIIDQKLEKLAAEVLLAQHDQIAFLARIDELNGLVVDLLS